MGNVQISTANVPEGTCPPWIIELWPELIGLLEANLTGSLNTFNYGSSTPDPADEDKPWFQLDSNGRPNGWWEHTPDGYWLKEHPTAEGIIVLWEGDISTIDTFDGGEGGGIPVTDFTGPMWVQVTALAGRFPIGAGALPTSGVVVPVTGTGGEEEHTLLLAEIPEHSHAVLARSLECEDGTGAVRLAPAVADPDLSYSDTGEAGSGDPHNNMPPYYGVHFIRKTARKFYRL